MQDSHERCFTYWIEFFHCNGCVVQDPFVHSAKASLSKSAAAIRYGPVIKVACNPNKVIVEETGET